MERDVVCGLNIASMCPWHQIGVIDRTKFDAYLSLHVAKSNVEEHACGRLALSQHQGRVDWT